MKLISFYTVALLAIVLNTKTFGQGTFILRHANVIDGTGAAPKPDTDILVSRGKIAATGKNLDAGNAKEVDLTGKTVIPALICAHAHIGTLQGNTSSADNYTRDNIMRQLRKYQDYGVGSILVMGTDRELIFDGLRDSTVAGLLPGARLFSAGYGFNVPDPNPGSWMNLLQRPASAEEVPAMIEKVAALKPTVIKIWVDNHTGGEKMTPEVYQAIIREAHLRKIRVAAHLWSAEDASLLADAGIDIIAHSIRDKEVSNALLAKLKKRNVIYIPTLSLDEYQFAYGGKPGWIEDEFFKKSLEPGVYEMLTDPNYPAQVKNSPSYQQNVEGFKTALINLKKIYDAGITVALGTDSGAFPIRTQGFTEHLEMELMGQAGLTPIQAITIGTLNAAKALKISTRYGSIVKGKMADLLILDADPMEDIRNTRKISAVWKDGKEVSRGPLAE